MIRNRAGTTAGAGVGPRIQPHPSSEPQRTTPTPRCAAPHPTAPRRAAPHRAVPRHAAPRHVAPHRTALHHAAPCPAATAQPAGNRCSPGSECLVATSANSKSRIAERHRDLTTPARCRRRHAGAAAHRDNERACVLTLRVHHSPHLNKGRNEAQATKTEQKEKRASGVRTLDPRPHCAIVCGPLTYHLELTRRTKGVLFTVPPAI